MKQHKSIYVPGVQILQIQNEQCTQEVNESGGEKVHGFFMFIEDCLISFLQLIRQRAFEPPPLFFYEDKVDMLIIHQKTKTSMFYSMNILLIEFISLIW